MFKLRDLRVQSKLFVVFALIITVIIGGSASFYTLTGMNPRLTAFITRLVGIQHLLEADRDAYQSSIAISHALNNLGMGADVDVSSYITEAKANIEQVNQRFEVFEKVSVAAGLMERISSGSIKTAMPKCKA